MKKNYNPKHLTKRQRHLKKWIPESVYCDDCPFWHSTDKKEYTHKREECQFGSHCEYDCSTCTEYVSFCEFLRYREYGQYPLGDKCKVCGIKDYWVNPKKRYFKRNIKGIKIKKSFLIL